MEKAGKSNSLILLRNQAFLQLFLPMIIYAIYARFQRIQRTFRIQTKN
jgi:hypothetical protein